jgi:Uma2 family endonuclease
VSEYQLYARCGMAEVWIVDLRRATIEVYRTPTLRGYRDRRDASAGERVASLAFPRKRLAVSAVLGITPRRS